MPDIGTEIAEIEESTIEPEKKIIQKDKLIQDYAVKSERIHTVNQLFKAYTLFERDIEYVLMDNKIGRAHV